MRPSPYVNMLIGGVIARALWMYKDVKLHALVVTSTHFHAIAQAPKALLSAFIAYIEFNIAIKVGRHHKWSGKFWHKRFDARCRCRSRTKRL